MTNAEAFSYYFGIYATELWAMPETQFLKWLNTVCDTNVGDTINRQATIDAIEILLEQSEYDENDKIWNNAIRGSINAVKNHVPSLQPKQHGHWQYGDDFYENAICSYCEWDSSEPMKYAKNNFLFCPNCGARMDKEDND